MAYFASRESAPKKVAEAAKFDLTAMIDVVFLLLVFFLLTATFVLNEQQLPSSLPRDGGGSGLPSSLTEINVDLAWHAGKTVARAWTTGFGPQGQDRITLFDSHYDASCRYNTPDFVQVESYLAAAGAKFGREVPVTIHADNSVPIQMVVSVMDACLRQAMTNLGLAAPESEVN